MATQTDIEDYILQSKLMDSLETVVMYLMESELSHYVGCEEADRDGHVLRSLAKVLDTLPRVAPDLCWSAYPRFKEAIDAIRKVKENTNG